MIVNQGTVYQHPGGERKKHLGGIRYWLRSGRMPILLICAGGPPAEMSPVSSGLYPVDQDGSAIRGKSYPILCGK